MSVCLDSTSSTPLSTNPEVVVSVQAPASGQPENAKSIAKLVVNNQQLQPGNPLIQKVVNSPLITVLNSTGPLTVVKSLCMTSMVASAPQYTLVNTTAANQAGKGPTITVLNCGSPVTVVKALTDKVEPPVVVANPLSPVLIENRGHNVFVKNSNVEVMSDMPQGHKLLTATNFSPNNIIGINPLKSPPLNGQRSNKVKILGNVQIASPQNVILNKTSIPPQPRFNLTGARQKLININAAKPNNLDKPQKLLHPPMQKGPIKSFIQKPGIKTLSPQHKNIPMPVRSGLKTIPPQRPKTNYIGKHAVQAQKVKPQKLKAIRPPGYGYQQDKQLTFNQALTAQIIETLSNTSNPPSGRYELSPARYDNAFNCPETDKEDKVKALDALSLICQAVLLDHNYNATLPSESPPRVAPPINTSPMNGLPMSVYSTIPKRRVLPLPPPPPPPMAPVSPIIVPPPSVLTKQDDDAASDVSDLSDRKHDTEGEETDTAPEAEDVKNDEHYGDYVTRCLCGFLHDDGYMVECDKCKVWQHVQCVAKNRQLPDEYLCEICDPSKPIDRNKARLVQQQWLKERQLIEPKIRKEAKLKEAVRNMTDSDSSDGELRNNNVKRLSIGRRKSESKVKKEAEPPMRRKRKEKKIMKRRPKVQQVRQQQQQQSHSDDENQDSWTTHLPTLRKWIEVYEEAVTNHYSPELRKRISSVRVNNNGAHADTVSYDTNVNNCRIHTQPLTEIKYLVSTVELEPNMAIIELRGKYMLGQQHKNNAGLTTRQHTQRPGPFLFFYKLPKDSTEVCVDTRTYGNSARFVRRSCKPNAELRHCIDKGVLHLYIVSISSVVKNSELTIRHESHDLAVVGTTQIACACGKPDECLVNKTSIKKNGDVDVVKRRRGRRTISNSLPSPDLKSPVKEPVTPVVEPPIPDPSPPQPVPEPSPPVVQPPPPPPPPPEPEPEIEKPEPVEEIKPEPEPEREKSRSPSPVKVEPKKEKRKIDEDIKSPPLTPIVTRRSSNKNSEKEDSGKEETAKEKKEKAKKLSREERKLEAILRAIEQMEKADQKKQEHQAKQAHRRESEPGPGAKEEEKPEPRVKRRRRRGRARTTSTNQTRRSRLNSTDSYMTSGDENLLSPNDSMLPSRPKDLDSVDSKAAGLLLALSNGDADKDKKIDNMDSSSNSSPETPQLSSACLLVQAAVEPLESGFKFPKTKKGLMNEWLNKTPDLQPASAISPSALIPHVDEGKNLAALAQAATFCDTPTQQKGNAKKRWLRQAISEDHAGDRPESPPLNDAVAPPKKRRLPRESLSNDNSPPSTPTTSTPKMVDTPRSSQEGPSDSVYSDCDSPTSRLAAELHERAQKMKEELQAVDLSVNYFDIIDPRLRDKNFTSYNSAHLVGTVEKTLSIFGFEATKTPPVTPVKRKVKLSISEYRQRKKLHNDDEVDSSSQGHDDNNSTDSFKAAPVQPRSRSSSSSSSVSSLDEFGNQARMAAPVFDSEPTELERQREITSERLKKAFGIADESRKAPDMVSILNCDVELPSVSVAPPQEVEEVAKVEEEEEEKMEVVEQQQQQQQEDEKGKTDDNIFYTPDEEEDKGGAGVSFVPAFNNPVYPSTNFVSFTSAIDDDTRYQSRNPSPPPDLEAPSFSAS